MQQKTTVPSRLLSYLLAASLSARAWVSRASAQETNQPVNAVEIIGLAGVKENTKCKLEVGNAKLHFDYGSTIRGFKPGSERERKVTTVAGTNSIREEICEPLRTLQRRRLM